MSAGPAVPTLVVIGGLPATGKTTVARRVAAALGAAMVRVDTVETALARAAGAHAAAQRWELPPGYAISYDLAADQLRAGLTVVAESVNPLRVTRDAWRAVGEEQGARVLEVELVCSDATLHRRRLETRVLDLPGLENPSWEQVTGRERDPWHRDHLELDTAVLSAEQAARRILDAS